MGNRRDFLGKACAACGAVFLSGAAVSALESCSSTKDASSSVAKPAGYVVTNGILKIPLTDLGESTAKIITAKGAPKEIYIAKNADGSYKVLLLKCPHMGGSVFQENQIFKCGLHGSTFDMSGKVTKGPAKDNLPVYKAEVSGSDLLISVS